jgi:hypothetical protein
VITLAFLVLCQEPPQAAKSPVMSGVLYLLSHQRPDGSWGAPPASCKCRGAAAPRDGGDLETVAWVILALGGAGFTELSKDDFNGRKPGDCIRSALDWLVSKQDQNGVFDRDNAEANAIASLAVTETYGMTILRKVPAEKAYASVEKAAMTTVVGRIRQGMVIESGKLSEIGVGHDGRLLELAASLKKEAGDLAKAGSQLLEGFVKFKRGMKSSLDLDMVRPLSLPSEALSVFASASFILEGGDQWHDWFKGLRQVLEPLQRNKEGDCESGSWDGEAVRDRIRNTAIRLLTVEHYRCFYCRNVFRKK